ncbi:MAG: class II aldolase/adducin family protein [Eubacterium sp.]|nr:class II aldolase/adducin family protein [Eubacterium sp.]
MGKEAKDFKNEVVLYAKMMDEKGLVNSVEGNLSVLDRSTGRLYITPSGRRKRFLTEETVAVLDNNEKQVEGEYKASSEYRLHLAALAARPDCNAVAHIHAPYLTAYAYCGKDIKLKCSTTFAMLFGEIPCLPYGRPGTVHIFDGIEEALKDHDLVLLANHGCAAVGKTLEDACKLVEAAEEVLKIYHLTREIGPVSDIPEDELEVLGELLKNR